MVFFWILEVEGTDFWGEGVVLRPFVLGTMDGAESIENGGIKEAWRGGRYEDKTVE